LEKGKDNWKGIMYKRLRRGKGEGGMMKMRKRGEENRMGMR